MGSSDDAVVSRDDHLADLLAAVARGDRDAFGALYDATCGPVFAVVRAAVAGERHSEEVLHETYLRIWQHAAAWNADHGTATTWCLALARRCASEGRGRPEHPAA
ncbi:sigma factor [Tersicoccus sp. Bi-70]|uniref:sigma factor n=1 Tax=Tersicoccus sp. Bi-70 TaxID=1897634 RepID=UPI0009771B05|nr:sigma factor [Tersicoccus sp. Bi-70]OMH32373.1 hypothetical protein BGP79_08120 [Tersicoccus sp. Bi-70]